MRQLLAIALLVNAFIGGFAVADYLGRERLRQERCSYEMLRLAIRGPLRAAYRPCEVVNAAYAKLGSDYRW